MIISPVVIYGIFISEFCLFIVVLLLAFALWEQNKFNRKTKKTFSGIVEWVQKIENYVKTPNQTKSNK